MWTRVITSVCAVFVLIGPALAGDMTRGLTITGGRNANATLKLERANDPGPESGVLKLHVSVAQTSDLKGYGISLQFDPAKYEFVNAKELEGNLLKSGSGQETLFLSSNRTPGQVDIGAVKIDGQGASGGGKLVELVFKTSGTPLSSDFQVSESVLVGLDGAVDQLAHAEIGNLKPLPDRFHLNQNMPNPFNPSTVIGYQLPEAGLVRLAIYNLLGQEVRVLVNERREAGSFSATWDGADALGRRVASGIYLYRIQAGGFSATKRMLLLK
ncbi:MAG: T9SS type A sorting domain-containing protein [Candidatus Latescibacteria bacterium]|nr:T9SS type A sorting domain-containing protein [Candidatus Latescibacterota bacterium]